MFVLVKRTVMSQGLKGFLVLSCSRVLTCTEALKHTLHAVIRLELRAEQPSADASYSHLIKVDISFCLSV